LKDVALPYLERLSRISNQNINLAILDRAEVVFIERINRWELLTINLSVGSRVNSYQSSSGRAILAFLDREKFESVLSQLSKDTEARKHIGSNGKKLKQVLEKVRRRGYALNDEELIKGVRAIAVPILNARGEVEGSITMPAFSHSVSRKELVKRYVPLLLDAAREISTARGFMDYDTISHRTRPLAKKTRQ
jgi:IclR family pca regulon transcriptional regulator